LPLFRQSHIIEINPENEKIINYGFDIPESVLDLKAEIKIRTLMEHSYADFTHTSLYKSKYAIPEKLGRVPYLLTVHSER